MSAARGASARAGLEWAALPKHWLRQNRVSPSRSAPSPASSSCVPRFPSLLPSSRDAVALSVACKALHAAVATSRWPPFSPLALLAEDGSVSEPPSGHFFAVVRPEQGGAGIQAALDACPPDGAILLLAGVFVVAESLAVHRPVHLFGRGAATLRGKGADRQPLAIVMASTSFASLSDVHVACTDEGSYALYVSNPGRLRLERCEVTSLPHPCSLVVADGSRAVLDVVDSKITGACLGVLYLSGATGSVVGCEVAGLTGAGVCVAKRGSRPRIAGNAFRACVAGVMIDSEVEPAFEVGEGNTFAECKVAGVLDQRAGANAMAALVAEAAAAAVAAGEGGAEEDEEDEEEEEEEVVLGADVQDLHLVQELVQEAAAEGLQPELGGAEPQLLLQLQGPGPVNVAAADQLQVAAAQAL